MQCIRQRNVLKGLLFAQYHTTFQFTKKFEMFLRSTCDEIKVNEYYKLKTYDGQKAKRLPRFGDFQFPSQLKQKYLHKGSKSSVRMVTLMEIIKE